MNIRKSFTVGWTTVQGWLLKETTIFKNSRLFLLLEILVIFAAFFALYFTWDGLTLAREEAKKERLTRSWQLLTTKAPGNSGKRQALQILAKNRQSLSGIDISCQAMGGMQKIESKSSPDDTATTKEKCVRRPYLQELDLSTATIGYQVNLSNANFSEADLYKANFSGANLVLANFSGAKLWKAKFSGAKLWEANFSGADLYKANFSGADSRVANFSGADLWGAKFSGADLYKANFSGADLWGAKFSGAKLSGANFSGADLLEANFSGTYLNNTDFTNAKRLNKVTHWGWGWAWSDKLPKGLSEKYLKNIQQCMGDEQLQEEHRKKMRKTKNYNPPNPCTPP